MAHPIRIHKSHSKYAITVGRGTGCNDHLIMQAFHEPKKKDLVVKTILEKK